MTISRRQVIGGMAGMAGMSVLAGVGGCSILSAGGDTALRINYAGAADAMSIPSPNPIETKLAEVAGLEVVSERSPEDLGAALAGSQAPDVFLSSRNQLRQYAKQGMLLDLTPYRDRLSDYEAYVGTDNVETGMIDGRMMSLVRKPREFSYGALWIRADWLDKLGLGMPKTTDEFTDALKAFRDEKPGRSDAVGLTGPGVSTFSPLFGAFETGTPASLYAHGKQVVDGYNDPEILAPLEYLRSLFQEKLVDPDLFALETAEARDRAFQGSAGAIYVGWDQMTKPEYVKAQKDAQPDADWQMIDVLSAPGKKGAVPTGPYGEAQGIPAELADDEERLDALLKVINFLGTEEGSRLVMFGIEGTHFTLDGDDVKALPAMEEEGAYFFAYQIAGRDEDTYLDVKFDGARKFWEACRDRPQIVQYEALVVPPEGFSAADANRYAEEQLALLLTGERNLNDYSKFLSELNEQFDYASYLDAARKQLDELGLPE